MKIFFIASCLPAKSDNRKGVLATHIQIFEHLITFAKMGHQVIFQAIPNQYQSLAPSAEDLSDILELKQRGIQMLESISIRMVLEGFFNRLLAFVRLFLNLTLILVGKQLLSFYYPSQRLSKIIEERIEAHRPDIIFFFTSSEGIAATSGISQVKKIAYQGDLDFAPALIRAADPQLFGEKKNFLNEIYRRLYVSGYKRAHRKLMQSVSMIANATASNVDFYKQSGHPAVFYVGPTWRNENPVRGLRGFNSVRKIIGHAGYLNRTSSAYGLRFLIKEVFPRLSECLKDLDYELHIIGGGEFPSSLIGHSTHPSIKLRGWVTDLDAELKSSDVFLFLNNAGPLKAAFSRSIIAWSMGLCLVAHSDQAKTIPETQHGHNALLGSTGEEIVQQVRRALTDFELNQRLRVNGRNTYETNFEPSVVCQKYFRAYANYSN